MGCLGMSLGRRIDVQTVDIIAGVDGTGPRFGYKENFSNSHVRYLCSGKATIFHHTYYSRGPTILGAETEDLSNGLIGWLLYKIASASISKHLFKGNSEPRIFLTGYSRGGAAVIRAANVLESLNIKVHCMVLLDAVDRSSVVRVDKVPRNVRNLVHAMRMPEGGSREFFENCGTKTHPSTNLAIKKFFAQCCKKT